MVMLLGTVKTGATVSLTMTLNVFGSDVLPAASDAVHLTVVLPSANVEPLGGTHATVGCGVTASVADVAKVTTAPLALLASAVMVPGTVRDGAVLSRTLTVNDPVVWLLASSVAVQLTVVVPTANVPPLAGVQLTVTVGSTASDAVTV